MKCVIKSHDAILDVKLYSLMPVHIAYCLKYQNGITGTCITKSAQMKCLVH